MAAAAAGFWFASVPLCFAVLFGLGVQAAFFSPLKYAILPDHLEPRELLAGNGLIEAGTFGGILAGTIAGSALFALPGGPVIVSARRPGRRSGGRGRRGVHPAGPVQGAGPARRRQPGARDRRRAARRPRQPAGVAVAPRAELVLGHRLRAAERAADHRAHRAGRQPRRVHGAAVRVLARRGRRVGRLRQAAARRGVGPAGAVRGARPVAVPVGFQPRRRVRRPRCRTWRRWRTASPAGAWRRTCCCWARAAASIRCRSTPSCRNARSPARRRGRSRPTTSSTRSRWSIGAALAAGLAAWGVLPHAVLAGAAPPTCWWRSGSSG